MDWFATHSAGILRGSLCEAEDTTQLIWIKFMAMANEAKDPFSGRLEFAKGHPYDKTYLATLCRKTEGDIELALYAFERDISPDGTARITIEADGTVVLNNWGKYQPKYRGKVKPSNDGSKADEANPEGQVAWDDEHKEARDKAMAYKGGYKQPESAQAGIQARAFEDTVDEGIKDRRKESPPQTHCGGKP